MRNQSAEDGQSYYGGIVFTSTSGGTALFIGRSNPGSSLTEFGRYPTDLDALDNDVVLQLDVINDEVSLWAWQAGQPMPAVPQLVAHDSTYASGFVGVVSTASRGNTSTFRYVHVANEHIIPEPATILLAMLGMASVCVWRRRR